MKLKIKYWLKLWELRLSEKLGDIEPETLIIAEDILLFAYRRKNLPIVMVIDNSFVKFSFIRGGSMTQVRINKLGLIWASTYQYKYGDWTKFNRNQILAFYSTFGKYI